MFSKTTTVVALAIFLATTAAAVAQGWQGGNGYYAGYGYGYGGSDRSNPTNTNGF